MEYTDMAKWQCLIFGSYNIKTVQDAVKDEDWQTYRVAMKGLPLEAKYKRLKNWLVLECISERACIQVTNYVYALKRGGLIK